MQQIKQIFLGVCRRTTVPRVASIELLMFQSRSWGLVLRVSLHKGSKQALRISRYGNGSVEGRRVAVVCMCRVSRRAEGQSMGAARRRGLRVRLRILPLRAAELEKIQQINALVSRGCRIGRHCADGRQAANGTERVVRMTKAGGRRGGSRRRIIVQTGDG